VKSAASFVLIAIASASLGASRSLATTTGYTTTSSGASTVLSSNGTDVSALFNAITLAATSVSAGSSVSDFSFLDGRDSNAPKHVDVVLPGLAPGSVLFRIVREGPPTARPIPEAKTILLYAFGVLTIGWTVLRSRRERLTVSSRAR
jgi:hypothetical protein